MYSEKIEQLIKAALADGVLTEKEKQILLKRAKEQDIDPDEFEMVLDARLFESQKAKKEQAEKPAPKSTKFGNVRKCPVCGAFVPAMAVSCAECGFEFADIEASSSAQTLSKEIAKINNSVWGFFNGDEKIEELIKNFPVPNAKHDLFDLIVFLKQHSDDIDIRRNRVYGRKLQECLDRAKYLFPTDPLFAQVIADAQKTENLKKAKKSGYIIMIAAGYIGMFVGWGVWYLAGGSTQLDDELFAWFVVICFFAGSAIGALIKQLYIKSIESK